MFTNMLSHHHHHRPGSPAIGISASSMPNAPGDASPAPEQKYAPLHNAADAMRRHCMPSPAVTYSGNLYAGFEESFLARAEALIAVDYTGKSQFKPEPSVSGYYPMGPPPPHPMPPQTHHHGMSMTAGAVPPPVYGAMPPPSHPGIHHPSPLHSVPQCVPQAPISITEAGSELMEQLNNPSHCSSFSSYPPSSFSTPSGLLAMSDASTVSYNPHPSISFHSNSAMAVSTVSSPIQPTPHHPNSVGCSSAIAHAAAANELDSDPRELEAFAERFKQRRIKLGVTQCDVGQALAKLDIAGVNSLSQSTICRFESLTVSQNNMIALKPILTNWLDRAEADHRRKLAESGMTEKKRKRTSIAAPEKRSLEAFFAVQQRPSSEKIATIADKLDLKKNVVRVWFCNQRQKQKRMKFSANNVAGETAETIHEFMTAPNI